MAALSVNPAKQEQRTVVPLNDLASLAMGGGDEDDNIATGYRRQQNYCNRRATAPKIIFSLRDFFLPRV